MSWKKERDLLIAQTMAFVQSVTGKKPDAGLAEAKPDIELALKATAPASAVEMLAAEIIAPPQFEPQGNSQGNSQVSSQAGSPANLRIPRSNVSSDIRSEMQARVANFRAHQERFNRERDEYFSATLKKLRTSIDNTSAPGRS
jgi:hypothetical protein